MPELIDPTNRLRKSFLEAVAESYADTDFGAPWYVRDIDPDALVDADAFDAYVARVISEREEEVALATGFVPMTTLWWVEGDEFLGRVAVRHRLLPETEKSGGHIGYNVRPSARRQGHATTMLAAALPIAAELGIDEALLTCDETNVASQRAIERNGGRLVDADGMKRRYLVPTRPEV